MQRAIIPKTCVPVLEALENRRLLDAALDVKVNFQTASAPVPAGYRADTGAKYGTRANGMTYGWSSDNTANARQRNGVIDQRYRTFNHMQKSGNLKWEISVPNGTYTVRVVAGDPDYTDSVFKINVENVLTVSGSPSASKHFLEGTKTVSVSDGRLTISNASGSSGNKIAFVEITNNGTSNNNAGSLSWASKGKGFARAESLGAVVGGKLYVMGGYINGKYLSSNRFDVYDPSANKWTQLPDMPQALTHAGCAYDDRYIYVAGGYSVNDAGTKQIFAINNVRRHDTLTRAWQSLPNLPQARGGGSMVLKNNELIFIGGSDINRADKADVWELHLDDLDNGWRAKASLPEARNHFAAVQYNGAVYAIGGQTGQDATSAFKRTVFKFNEDANSWTKMADMINQPRSHIAYASFVHNGKIIVAGGETDSGTPNKPKILNNVEQYDPNSNKWSSLKPLPASRTSGVAGSFGDKIIYATGSTGSFVGDTWIGTFT